MRSVLPSAVRMLSLIATLTATSLAAANLAVPGPAQAAESAAPANCQLPRSESALTIPLTQLSQRIATGAPIRIVAIGSSSTAGAGASAPDKAYPARLDHYLSERFRNADIVVLNRGINGETDDQTEKRIEADALGAKPDLVIWQVGANTVLRDGDQSLSEQSVRQGVAQLRAAGVEVVLMDLQYSPRMLEKTGVAPMLTRIAGIASDNRVGLFHRFDVMKSLVETRGMTMADLIGPDGVHGNDAGYDCVARMLAVGIEDAVSVHNSGLQR